MNPRLVLPAILLASGTFLALALYGLWELLK